MVLFGTIPLKLVSLRSDKDDPSVQRNELMTRGRIGGIIHSGVYAAVIGLLLNDLSLYGSSSENISLILLFAMSLILLASGLVRLAKSTEGTVTRFGRNLLSSMALLLSFLALGRSDAHSEPLDRNALGWLIGLIVAGRVGDVLVNKKEADEADCEKPENAAPFMWRRLLTWTLIAASLGFVIAHKVNENTATLDFTSDREGVNLSAIILISVHLLLDPLNMLITCSDSMSNNVIDMITCRRCKGGRINSECESERGMLLPLNRSPFYRHIVASSVISLLGYSLGCSIGVSDFVSLATGAAMYFVADVTGRGLDVVAL